MYTSLDSLCCQLNLVSNQERCGVMSGGPHGLHQQNGLPRSSRQRTIEFVNVAQLLPVDV